jgi:lipid II isoglutaminyl synthase (glutamine-hydrolysing)
MQVKVALLATFWMDRLGTFDPTSKGFMLSDRAIDVRRFGRHVPAVGSRARIALSAGWAAGWLSRVAGRGAGDAIGGKVSLAIEPRLLATLARKRTVSLVTGTNGKTTTTRLLAETLSTVSTVATSRGGNLPHALVAPLSERGESVVLEVDELWLPHVAGQVSPRVVVLMNLNRDQLDRTSEVRRVATVWRRFAESPRSDCTIVANADDPSIVWALWGRGQVVWVAGGAGWDEDLTLCPPCGRLWQRGVPCCCGFQLPVPRWRTRGDSAIDVVGGTCVPLRLSLPGACHREDALLALAAAVEIGVRPGQAARAMEAVHSVEHRFETVRLGAHDVRLMLGKNPASWHELLAILERDESPVVVCLNAEVADGTDTSWIWDVPFERLAGRRVVACGTRRTDLALRLDAAGLDVAVADDPLEALAGLPRGRVELVGTYTAFHEVVHRIDAR